MNLKSRLLLRFSVGLICGLGLVFIPAGSLRFWQGWAWLAAVFPPFLFSSYSSTSTTARCSSAECR